MATIMCAACVVVMCSGYQARAETTADFPVVSNANQLLQAIAAANDGDTIGISDNIAFYEGVTLGTEDKNITIIRVNEEAHFSFSGTGSFLIQNIMFDGNDIESMYSMICSQRHLTVKNSFFQNCICNGEGAAVSNMERTEFYNCIFKNNSSTGRGGHVSMYHGIFDNCILTDGDSNFEGGAVACGSVDFNNCLITRNHAGMYGGGVCTSGITVLTGTKLYNNTAGACGPDYVDTQNGVHISESIEELAALYKSDGLKPISWEKTQVGFMIGGKLILEEFVEKPEPEQPTIPEEPETPDNPDNPTEPENPDQPDTPTEPGENEQPKDEPGTGTDNSAEDENGPSEPETPPDDTQNKGDEQPPADNPQEKPGVSGSGNAPEAPSDSAGNNGSNNTSNSTSTTTTSDNRTTDNSDNSRYSSTSDSNNTSTVNNYYQQEKQPSSGGESVQTIVVPVGNTGNGEPLQQTIRVESPEGTTATGNLEGLTLNINVNTASQDQAANTSPIQQSGIFWYQAIVLCLLSAILVCLLKQR